MRSKRAKVCNVRAMSEEDAGIAMMAQIPPPLVVLLRRIDVVNDLVEITGDKLGGKGKRIAPKFKVSKK